MATVLVIAGCGGDGVSIPEPEPPFPAVAGTYNIEGGFDAFPRSAGSFVGTLVLTQASRESGTLGGTITLTATIVGDVLTAADIPLEEASVTAGGVVSFQPVSEDPATSWTFSGTLSGNTLSGRHTLTDGSQSYSGDWTGTVGGGGPATGSVSVTTSTSGDAPDPNGYNVTVDGQNRGSIGTSGSITIAQLTPGGHSVGLTDLAPNCAVEGSNPRTATVPAGGTVAVSFVVSCPGTQPGTGSIRVTTSTSGPDQDPNGYLVSLDGGAGLAIGVGGELNLSSVAPGSHSISLSDVAANCTVAGGATRPVSVTSGATADVSFAISCSAIPPQTGSIRITTSTTGPAQDPDGYTATLDGAGSGHALPVTGTATITPVAVGSHTLVLSGVAGNCTVAEGRSRTVTVTGGATSEVSFSITCAGPTPSRISLVSGDDQSGTVGGLLADPLVVRVTDQDGDPVSGVEVQWTAQGGGSVSQATTITGGDGLASVERTLGTTAGEQTTQASVDGLQGSPVTFTHTGTAGAVATMTKTAPDNREAPSGTAIDAGVLLQDQYENPVPGISVEWTIVQGEGSVSEPTTVTGADGRATVQWSLGLAGTNQLRAEIDGRSDLFTAIAGPSPSHSTVLVDPASIPADGTTSSTITVTVKDVGDNLLDGVSVTATSSDSDDQITSSTTNSEGVAALSFTSTKWGTKTITVEAGGVTLDETEEITVDPLPTGISITNEEPSTSTAGEAFPVTFEVRTSDDGFLLNPSGTVEISSDFEPQAACQADISQGETECSMELTQTGLHRLTATYSGDDRYGGSTSAEFPHTVEEPASGGIRPQE